jgi:hypothetical protein
VKTSHAEVRFRGRHSTRELPSVSLDLITVHLISLISWMSSRQHYSRPSLTRKVA